MEWVLDKYKDVTLDKYKPVESFEELLSWEGRVLVIFKNNTDRKVHGGELEDALLEKGEQVSRTESRVNTDTCSYYLFTEQYPFRYGFGPATGVYDWRH